jgi:hypothetical protein
MQTFLPYPNFNKSAEALDKKRCWKQVVETAQIINILEAIVNTPPQGLNKTIAWRNHPAVQMWIGHTVVLKNYFNAFLEVCIEKHEINTKYTFMDDSDIRDAEKPWWLGNEDFHRAMRARLIEKDEAFYLPLFPNDKGFNNSKYFWPVMDDTKTFKII